MDIKPIPAFYGVYLLRSTVRKASTYIGSTPHPSRRLGQHNGRVTGGAVRTSRASLRPWEMACIVAGFPSNIAALQFEWAWQNAHLTRHISAEQRISRPGRPSSSLMDRLSNLHLLLRVPYFSQWPLQVRFFSQDVYASWTAWCERVDEQIRPGISVQLDLPESNPPVAADDDITSAQPPSQKRKADLLLNKGGVYGIDPTYARYQDVLTKSVFMLDDGDGQKCELCQEAIHLHDHLFTICPNNDCQSISHVTCLSKHFLQHSNSGQLVPEQGQCPACHSPLRWVDLMTQLTLRNRGQKDVQKILRKKRKPKATTAAEVLETDSEDDFDQEEEQNLELGALVGQHVAGSDSDTDSIVSLDSVLSSTRPQIARPSSQSTRPLEIVIEDSDDQR
ncbi:hypothetical protein DV738_g3238, partial [Chaetothyriales sp. CBS 135597]